MERHATGGGEEVKAELGEKMQELNEWERATINNEHTAGDATVAKNEDERMHGQAMIDGAGEKILGRVAEGLGEEVNSATLKIGMKDETVKDAGEEVVTGVLEELGEEVQSAAPRIGMENGKMAVLGLDSVTLTEIFHGLDGDRPGTAATLERRLRQRRWDRQQWQQEQW